MKKQTNLFILFLLISITLTGCSSITSQPIEKNKETETNMNLEADKQERKAIDLVKSKQEVQDWLKEFSNGDGSSPVTGGIPVIVVDSVEGNIYSVHAYESLPERNVTFAWYDVDLIKQTVTDLYGNELE